LLSSNWIRSWPLPVAQRLGTEASAPIQQIQAIVQLGSAELSAPIAQTDGLALCRRLATRVDDKEIGLVRRGNRVIMMFSNTGRATEQGHDPSSEREAVEIEEPSLNISQNILKPKLFESTYCELQHNRQLCDRTATFLKTATRNHTHVDHVSI